MRRDQTITEVFGVVIHSYTRAEAIADGVLVDVSKTAQEAGFRWPVTMTAAAWADCVEWSEEDSRRQVHQDESGRLWDVLWMALVAIRSNTTGESQIAYQLYRVPRDGESVEARLTTLKLVAGPGDAGEPVVTIMLPQED
jgi:hypothetical protein